MWKLWHHHWRRHRHERLQHSASHSWPHCPWYGHPVHDRRSWGLCHGDCSTPMAWPIHRFLQLWLVRRFHPRSPDYLWDSEHQQQLVMESAFPLPVLCVLYRACFDSLIPESPRWLFATDQEEKAMNFLAEYHGNGNRESRLVQLEIEEIQESIRQEYSDNQILWWDFSCLFNCREARWRSSQVIMMAISGQFSGNGLGYFNPQIFSELGVKSKSQSLGFNVLSSVLSALGAGTGVTLTDHMPRRKILVWGTLVATILLAINGACNHVFSNDISNKSVARASQLSTSSSIPSFPSPTRLYSPSSPLRHLTPTGGQRASPSMASYVVALALSTLSARLSPMAPLVSTTSGFSLAGTWSRPCCGTLSGTFNNKNIPLK